MEIEFAPAVGPLKRWTDQHASLLRQYCERDSGTARLGTEPLRFANALDLGRIGDIHWIRAEFLLSAGDTDNHSQVLGLLRQHFPVLRPHQSAARAGLNQQSMADVGAALGSLLRLKGGSWRGARIRPFSRVGRALFPYHAGLIEALDEAEPEDLADCGSLFEELVLALGREEVTIDSAPSPDPETDNGNGLQVLYQQLVEPLETAGTFIPLARWLKQQGCPPEEIAGTLHYSLVGVSPPIEKLDVRSAKQALAVAREQLGS